jgi:hypothetical protein
VQHPKLEPQQEPQPWRSIVAGASYPHLFKLERGRTPATDRHWFVGASRQAVAAVKAGFCNFGGLNMRAEQAGPHPITLSAALELNTRSPHAPFAATGPDIVLHPFSFAGAPSAVLAPGETLWSDPLPVTLGPSQGFYVRTRRVVPHDGACVATRFLRAELHEWTDSGWFNVRLPVAAGTALASVGLGGLGDVVLPLCPGHVCLYGGPLPRPLWDDGNGRFPATAELPEAAVDYARGTLLVRLATALPPGRSLLARGFGAGGAADDALTEAAPGGLSTKLLRGDMQALWNLSFGPAAVLGRAARAAPPLRTIGIVGDSLISAGGNAAADRSWVDYLAGPRAIGTLRVSQGGERAIDFAAAHARRLAVLAGHCDAIIGGYGTNDFGRGDSLEALQAALELIWPKLAALLPQGWRALWWSTLPPCTLSPRDMQPRQPAFGAATVASGRPSARNAYHHWLYRKLAEGGSIGGIVDLNAVLENQPDSSGGAGDGVWKLSGGASACTADGVHLSTRAQTSLIAAVFGGDGSAPSALLSL